MAYEKEEVQAALDRYEGYLHNLESLADPYGNTVGITADNIMNARLVIYALKELLKQYER